MSKINKRPTVESRCCKAPSTPMSQAFGLTANRDRRCVRCRQVFCAIQVRAGEVMRPLIGNATNTRKFSK